MSHKGKENWRWDSLRHPLPRMSSMQVIETERAERRGRKVRYGFGPPEAEAEPAPEPRRRPRPSPEDGS